MKRLFELISENKEKKDCVLVSGIDGKMNGEKLFFVDAKLVYSTTQNDITGANANVKAKAPVGANANTEANANVKEKAPVGANANTETSVILKKYSKELLQTKSTGVCSFEEGEAFVEHFDMNARIIVCGAGTVGLEVVKLGKQLGLCVVVLEDREEYAELAKGFGADEVHCTEFEKGLAKLEEKNEDYYIVVTREHQFDKVCLTHILNRKHAYVGMMASRNRAAVLKDELRKELIKNGKDEEAVESLHSPIGLKIKAETPAEIAVSIYAEIIQCRNGRERSEGFTKEILEAIIQKAPEEKMILATIVKRDGSAPRDIGTKMLIYKNGAKIGSVGGGWIEAGVLERAKEMFEGNKKTELYETEKESENASLCGGYETIYLEMIGASNE